MATKVWQGQAPAVAQVDKIGISTYDAATQYQLLVNGEVICSASGGGSTAAVASALASGWNAVTGVPYATVITALATGSDVQLTADVGGIPFTVAGNVTGGTGTIGTATGQTANAGPNVWSTAANWSGAAVPVNTDDVVFRDSAVDVLWDLDQGSVTLDSLTIEQSYTGKIGLNQRAFVTGTAGAENTARPDYRADYLDIGWQEARIGETVGPGSPAGSGRLKLENARKAASSTTEIFNTGDAAADANQPVVRLILDHSAADLYVRDGSGGVGLCTDDPAETGQVNKLEISDTTVATRVYVGAGVTVGSFVQQGGDNVLRAAAGITTVSVLGGSLTIEGQNYAITTLNAKGGNVYPNNTPTGGNAITTINVDGGTVDGTRSREPRTWGTVNLESSGGALRADDDVITITTLNEPDGPYEITVV